MDLIAKSKELRENPEYSGPIWDLERLETMYEMEVEITALKEQLKAELELRDKVIEQATAKMETDDWRDIVARDLIDGMVVIGSHRLTPELYAHLAGRGE